MDLCEVTDKLHRILRSMEADHKAAKQVVRSALTTARAVKVKLKHVPGNTAQYLKPIEAFLAQPSPPNADKLYGLTFSLHTPQDEADEIPRELSDLIGLIASASNAIRGFEQRLYGSYPKSSLVRALQPTNPEKAVVWAKQIDRWFGELPPDVALEKAGRLLAGK